MTLNWIIPQRTYELPPSNIALLDTNVLVAISKEDDSLHAQALARLDEAEFAWVVPHISYIEAWNFLVGREKSRRSADRLFAWVSTPGNTYQIGEALEPFDQPNLIAQKFALDLVDVSLADLATRMKRECGLHSTVAVATYDTGDFLRLFKRENMDFRVFDMRDGEIIE